MTTYKLPKSLKLGVATAATQIEGIDPHNNWYEWFQKGKVKGGMEGLVACDHWNRVEEDTRLMKELSVEVYRFSIEWSRIEPREGEWSEKGIQHYIDEVDLMLANNIEPLVTLHHFSVPDWVQETGGWTNKKTIRYFLRFTEKVVSFLGDRVCEYCVVNEPNVFVNDTYMEGKYPGGENGKVLKYFKAARNLIVAHVKAYQLIHQLRISQNLEGETKVGAVHHMSYFELNTKNPLFKITERFVKHSFHNLFLKGAIEGKLSFPFFPKKISNGNCFADFIGINYYTRSMITPAFKPATLFGRIHYKENLAEHDKTDVNWEIFPEGLYALTKELYQKYKLPIYITENGLTDAEDKHRRRFINEHLYQLKRLIDEGVDVQKFYYWCLMDNLEWDDGFGPRIGLIHVDHKTQKRTIRPSAYNFKNIIETRTIEVDGE